MKTTSLYIFLASLWVTFVMSTSHSTKLPTRVLAGVTVPDTPLIRDALDYARQHTTPGIFNHVVRSWLYGIIISSRVPALESYDRELHAVSTILHDLGWDPTGALVTPNKRFEVDGANAAREFIRSKAPSWDHHKQQLVWHSIALHALRSQQASRGDRDQHRSGRGLSGPNNVSAPGLTWDEWDTIVRALSRSGFKNEVQGIAVHLCQTKKSTTADNWIGEYGEKYIAGFNITGYRPIDFVLSGVP